ncbi:MAG: response regulator transcription factor [Chloroflexi bacterium]|nr:response regulator transcription factor [Chloroflexota bacterium]
MVANARPTTSEKIRVLIADDHPAFRQGLGRVLGEEGDIEVVGVVDDGEKAVKLVDELKPDVLIMDIAMPNLNGIEATKRIKAARANTSIIVLSAYGYESYVSAAIEAGAAAYLLKTVPVTELAGAIRAVHAGETVLDATAARKLFDRLALARGKEGAPQQLLHRELEVLRLGARGLSNRTIATKLVISERTVQTHFANVFRKLGVNSRTAAVLHALKEGWITLDDLA